MLESNDILFLAVGGGIFAFFLGLHFIVFRWIKSEHLFQGIIGTFCAAFITGVGVSIGVLGTHAEHIALALVIYVLAAFVYVLCFFGPYETSIRMRLVRELSANPSGVAVQDLLGSYNESVILDIRLKRLLGSRDVVCEGEIFKIAKKGNAFYMIDAISRKLHAFIHAG
jgi:hypothetical protein